MSNTHYTPPPFSSQRAPASTAMARSALGGPRKADESAAKQARKAGQNRKALALEFRAEKKRLLTDLENRLTLVESRSRKAGKVKKL